MPVKCYFHDSSKQTCIQSQDSQIGEVAADLVQGSRTNSDADHSILAQKRDVAALSNPSQTNTMQETYSSSVEVDKDPSVSSLLAKQKPVSLPATARGATPVTST